MLTQVERQRLKFGAKEKVISLCQHYKRINSAIWLPATDLAELLFDETV